MFCTNEIQTSIEISKWYNRNSVNTRSDRLLPLLLVRENDHMNTLLIYFLSQHNDYISDYL